jgi:hypothetical protein
MTDPFDLQRFLVAQTPIYARVLAELRHLDLAHRHPRRAAGGLCMVPRGDIGRGEDPGRRKTLRGFRKDGYKPRCNRGRN